MKHEGVRVRRVVLFQDARIEEELAPLLARVVGDGTAVFVVRLLGVRAKVDTGVAVDGPTLALGEGCAIADHPRVSVVLSGLLQH